MPDFTFTSPEGRSYTVSGPPGATKEQAFAILQGRLGVKSASPPAMPEGRIPTGVPSVDYTPEPMAPPQPSITDKVVGGVQGAMQLAGHVVEGLGGMFGTAAGTLGGVIGAVQTKLTGGAQPDSDAVRAVTGPGRPGAPDAIDEAGAQGASAVQGVAHAAGERVKRAWPIGTADAVSTPQSQAVAEDVAQRGGEILSHDVDPYAGMALHAPAGAPANAAARSVGRVDQALNAAQAVPGKVAGAAKDAGASALAKVMPKPDAEMLKTATMAADKFPDIQVLPHHLQPAGSSARAALAQKVSDLPGAGAPDFANRQAISQYAIRIVDPENTSGRLTPASLDAGLDNAYKLVQKGYDVAGPQDGHQLGKLLDPLREDAARVGAGDAPRLVEGYAQQLLGKADPETGEIPIAAVQEWDKRLGKAARETTDPGLARRLSDLQSVVREQVEKQLPPDAAADMRTGRRRYAQGIELQPVARAPGTVNSGIINDPSQILRAVTDDRNGKIRVARDAGGDLVDLAKVADLVKPGPTGPPTVHVPGVHELAQAAKGAVGVTAGQVYNRAGPAVTRMLAPKAEAPAAPPGPAPLELAPQEPMPAGAPPAGPGPLGDLTPEWGTTPGAGAPPAAEPLDATGLHPALDEPAVTTGNRAPPSQGAPGSQIPAVPGRPDLPDTMVSGPPGETAATEAANVAMNEPGAVAARETQSAPAAEAPAPKATPAEQAKIDEIDRLIASTQSDVVRETLTKERGRVVKEAAAREAADKAKADAVELRTHAMTMTDKATRDALIARADKLDPPEKVPAGTATEGQPEIPDSAAPAKPLPTGTAVEGQPEIKASAPPAKPIPVPEATEYNLSDPEWHAMYGNLGVETTERIKLARTAQDIDPAAEAAALERYAKDPEGYVKALKAIIAKGKTGENQPAPHLAGGEGPQAAEGAVDQSAGKAPAR